MKFSLATIAYVFALLAASMATFGWAKVRMALFLLFRGIRDPAPASPRFLAAVVLMSTSLLMATPGMATPGGRNPCLNNVRQILLGIENYRDARGQYPPAYSTDRNEKPLLSWRVLILPYMEMGALYRRFRLDEPWDGPNNRKLISQMPDVFACPGVARCRELGCPPYSERPEHVANYVAVVGDVTMWPPGKSRRPSEVTDKLHETVVLLEYSGATEPWTAPVDLTLEEALNLLEKGPPQGHILVEEKFFTISHYSSLYLVGMASAWGNSLSATLDRDTTLGLMTVSGGEDLSQQVAGQPYERGDVVTLVRWGRVFGAIVLVSLMLLMPLRLRRQAKSSEGSPAAR